MVTANTPEWVHDDFVCPMCGERDICPSEVIFRFRYGSNNDGETVSRLMCGKCIDLFFAVLPRFATNTVAE